MKYKLSVCLFLALVSIFALGCVKTHPPKETERVVVRTVSVQSKPKEEPDLESLGIFTVTGYCPCKKCCGIWAEKRPKDENGNMIVYTASGAIAEANNTIAVDTRIIPYGTNIVINGITYTAQDTMAKSVLDRYDGKIIDIYFENHEDAVAFAKQTHEVFKGEQKNESL